MRDLHSIARHARALSVEERATEGGAKERARDIKCPHRASAWRAQAAKIRARLGIDHDPNEDPPEVYRGGRRNYRKRGKR